MVDLAGFEPATRRLTICSSIGIRKEPNFCIHRPATTVLRDIGCCSPAGIRPGGFQDDDEFWQDIEDLNL